MEEGNLIMEKESKNNDYWKAKAVAKKVEKTYVDKLLIEKTNIGSIYMVRHGERIDETVQAENWYRVIPREHSHDPTLTEKGKLQASNAGKRLLSMNVNAKVIYASPYIRCVETAHEISKQLNLPIILHPGLSTCCAHVKSNRLRGARFYSRAELLSMVPDLNLTTDDLFDITPLKNKIKCKEETLFIKLKHIIMAENDEKWMETEEVKEGVSKSMDGISIDKTDSIKIMNNLQVFEDFNSNLHHMSKRFFIDNTKKEGETLTKTTEEITSTLVVASDNIISSSTITTDFNDGAPSTFNVSSAPPSYSYSSLKREDIIIVTHREGIRDLSRLTQTPTRNTPYCAIAHFNINETINHKGDRGINYTVNNLLDGGESESLIKTLLEANNSKVGSEKSVYFRKM